MLHFYTIIEQIKNVYFAINIVDSKYTFLLCGDPCSSVPECCTYILYQRAENPLLTYRSLLGATLNKIQAAIFYSSSPLDRNHWMLKGMGKGGRIHQCDFLIIRI